MPCGLCKGVAATSTKRKTSLSPMELIIGMLAQFSAIAAHMLKWKFDSLLAPLGSSRRGCVG